jgi:hypothetical protein
MGRGNRYRKRQNERKKCFFFQEWKIVKCGNKPEGSSMRKDVGKEKGRRKENGLGSITTSAGRVETK